MNTMAGSTTSSHQSTLPAVRFVQGRDRTIIHLSPDFEQLFGLAAPAVRRDPSLFEALFDDEDLQRYMEACEAEQAPGVPLTQIYRVEFGDNSGPRALVETRWRQDNSTDAHWEGIWHPAPMAEAPATANPSIPRSQWHDLVNLIGGVYALSELCAASDSDEKLMRDNLEMICDSARRAHALAQHIAAATRGR